ncbi:hypothetical protein F183_A52000 [Bryobacterales bacterium F-183]|nr:hypothetical protein F183_A52000 [Bryobacterales bacterium F-183]
MKFLTVLLVLVGTAVFFVTEARNAPPRNEWSIRRGDTDQDVQFTMESRYADGRWRTTSPVPVASLKGLTRDQLSAMTANVKFEVVRDAGTLVCEGQLHFGRGSGPFTFTVNPNYQQEMEKLGFRTSVGDGRRQLDYFLMDLSLDYAKLVRDADPNASAEDLIEMRNHGVDREYISGMRDAGFTNIKAHDYVEMRNHGVTAEYARDIKRTGYPADPENLVHFRNHGVSVDFIAQLRRAGYEETADAVVQLRNQGIDARYIQKLQEAGVKLDAEDMIQLRNHGVEPAFLREAKSLGYNFTTDEVVDLRNNGVDAAYLRKVRASGFENLTAEKIIKLRQHGVD